jgi:hypothetical protein
MSEWDSTTNVAHYARLAKELRQLATQVKSVEAREQMIVLAIQYEHLAAHAAHAKNEVSHSVNSERTPGPH